MSEIAYFLVSQDFTCLYFQERGINGLTGRRERERVLGSCFLQCGRVDLRYLEIILEVISVVSARCRGVLGL